MTGVPGEPAIDAGADQGYVSLSSPRFVLDCSTTMAWCFEDEGTDATRRALAMLRAGGAVVPQLWPLEIANVLAIAERRSRVSRAEATEFIALLDQLDIEVDGATADRALSATIDLAREHAFSAYDAAYLELAMRRGLPLATNDQRLARVAEAVGVSPVE